MDTNNLMVNLPEDLSGKKILVAGGTKGVAREITLMLADRGAKVMVLGDCQADLDQTMAELRSRGRESDCYGMVADPADPMDINIILTVIDRQFRGVDILINNNMFAFPHYMAEGDRHVKGMLYSKLQGQFKCSKEIAERMHRKGSGYIYNINTLGKEFRDQYNDLYQAAEKSFKSFNTQLRKEISDQNIKISLSSV
jgi:short-subunit dehydrogenase